MTNLQPRDNLGKFDFKTTKEPVGANMALSVFNREDATFEFPSIATTSDYCINFWSTASIPTEVFTQFSDRHRSYSGDLAREKAENQFYSWKDSFGDTLPDDDAQRAEWDRIRSEINNELLEGAMDPRDVTTIARAALMYHNAPDESYGDQRDQVLDYEVHLSKGSTTVAEIVDKYGTEHIYDSVSALPRPTPNLDQEMIKGLFDNLQGSIDTLANRDMARENTVDQLATVQSDLIELQRPVAEFAKAQLSRWQTQHEGRLDARVREADRAQEERIEAALAKKPKKRDY